MRVIVELYRTEWQDQFQTIRAQLEKVLERVDYCSIEHVGSTSVPGLAAKPVIDVDIVIRREARTSVVEALRSAGYHYFGDRGIPDRYAFKPPEQTLAQNIYVCIEGSQGLRNHLLVRDICRQNEAVRNRYSQTKLELAERDWPSIDEYCMAKNDILEWVLKSSGGMPAAEIEQIRTVNTRP